jgi:hypothetical protein
MSQLYLHKLCPLRLYTLKQRERKISYKKNLFYMEFFTWTCIEKCFYSNISDCI